MRSATVNGAAQPARLLVDARRHRSGTHETKEALEDLPDPLEVLAKELDAVKAAGIEEGYRQATDEIAAAAAEARTRRAAEVTRAVNAFAQARAALDKERARATEVVEGEVATLAFSLIETLLGRELALSAAPGLDAVRRALALAPDAEEIIVRLNPADIRVVEEEIDDVGLRRPGMSLVADETVEPGGAMVDVGACRIDAQISPALERVRQALGVPTATRFTLASSADTVEVSAPTPRARPTARVAEIPASEPVEAVVLPSEEPVVVILEETEEELAEPSPVAARRAEKPQSRASSTARKAPRAGKTGSGFRPVPPVLAKASVLAAAMAEDTPRSPSRSASPSAARAAARPASDSPRESRARNTGRATSGKASPVKSPSSEAGVSRVAKGKTATASGTRLGRRASTEVAPAPRLRRTGSAL
jgi:flagellar assembly protein FliH